MFLKMSKSFVFKPVSLLLAVSFLLMSFVAPQGKVKLTAGTLVSLETVNRITSENISAGSMIDFRVRHNVTVDDKVVITAGTIAQGQVVRSQKAKGLGKAGYIEVKIKTVKSVDGQLIPLTGSNMYEEGKDKQDAALILGILVCVLFLTKKGGNAEIIPGTAIDATIASNILVKCE